MSELPDDDEKLLEALLAMVVADGDVDPDELTIASKSYADLTGRTVEIETLEARANERLGSLGPTMLPPSLGVGLDDAAKRRVLLAALAIAEADGFVLEEEDALLAKLVERLGLPSAAYREAIEGRAAKPR